MMQRYTNQAYEAVMPIVIKQGDKLKSVNAVIDTGFTGFLSIPSSMIAELELPCSYRDRATLGDGSETLFDVHDANVIWDGQFREIDNQLSRYGSLTWHENAAWVSVTSRYGSGWGGHDHSLTQR